MMPTAILPMTGRVAEYDGSGCLLRNFIYGPGIDEPICMIDCTGESDVWYFYHLDGLGSVVALSNTSGSIVWKYMYLINR